jgi:hypothetical protein
MDLASACRTCLGCDYLIRPSLCVQVIPRISNFSISYSPMLLLGKHKAGFKLFYAAIALYLPVTKDFRGAQSGRGAVH